MKVKKDIEKYISVEKSKLDHKKRYKVIGTGSSRIIDELASYTACTFDTQIAIINFVDHHGIWPRKIQPEDKILDPYKETNVCSLAILNDMVNPLEQRIAAPAQMTNIVFAAEIGMRFYVAVPITTDDGIRMGTICIVDENRREFLPEDQVKLERIAVIVGRKMDKRVAKRMCA